MPAQSVSDVLKASEEKIDLAAANATISKIKPKMYDGMSYTPVVKVTVKDGKKQVTLTEGVDYSVKYTNNVNAGTGQVIIQGGGNYTGSVTQEFTINKKPISKLKIVADGMTVNSKAAPSIWIYDGSRMVAKRDYKLEYDSSLTQKKTASAKVKVIAAETSNYTGSAYAKVAVYELKESEMLITSKHVTFTTRTAEFTGKPITTDVEPIVKVNQITLEKNKDYTVQYQNNVNAGDAYVIVTGRGNYKGKVVGSFKITPASKSELEIKAIPDQTYTGTLQKPAVSVKAGKKTLKLNKDYTVAYGRNLNATTAAAVTVTGIGNYAGAKKSVTFVIKPQNISKASIQGSMTSGITLLYNKRMLQLGRDYNAPVYSTVKGSSIAVTITGKGNFTGEMTKSAKIDVPASKMTPVISTNINRQNYVSFNGSLMSSYLVEADGNLMRVEYVGGKGVYAEIFNEDFTFVSRKYIKMELPKFGGFFEGKDYYFLVFGQRNPEESNDVEVMRVVKYYKKWKRKGALSIYGANTIDPFKNGSLRMEECGDMLFIRSCHQMYKSYDGNNHQASMAFSVRISKMELIEQVTGISQTAYVSHSFNQFILRDGSDLLAVDHGDAYPRSVVLAKYARKAEDEKVINGGCYRISVLPIQGKVGNPYTGVSVGGLEASNTAYLTAGNSVEQNSATYNSSGVRNIFVTSTLKDNYTNEGTTVHWITNYKETTDPTVSTPQLVKISGDEFMLMWMEGTQVRCVLLNALGEPVTGIYGFDSALSDCKPIVIDKSVVWYYTNNSEPVFCTLKIEDVRNQTK